jgi:hypothetical protein
VWGSVHRTVKFALSELTSVQLALLRPVCACVALTALVLGTGRARRPLRRGAGDYFDSILPVAGFAMIAGAVGGVAARFSRSASFASSSAIFAFAAASAGLGDTLAGGRPPALAADDSEMPFWSTYFHSARINSAPTCAALVSDAP